jgi:trimethylamine monooxygenase
MIDFQTDYMKDIVKDTDYPRLDLDMAARLFKEWEHHKEESILGYRDHAFASPVNGTMAPVHHTRWFEAMDDSMQSFLATKGSASVQSSKDEEPRLRAAAP